MPLAMDARSGTSGVQMSVPAGNMNVAGMIPTTMNVVPLSTIARSTSVMNGESTSA